MNINEQKAEITNYFSAYTPHAYTQEDGTTEIDLVFPNLRVFFVLDKTAPFWGYVSTFWGDGIKPLETYREAEAIIRAAKEYSNSGLLV